MSVTRGTTSGDGGGGLEDAGDLPCAPFCWSEASRDV